MEGETEGSENRGSHYRERNLRHNRGARNGRKKKRSKAKAANEAANYTPNEAFNAYYVAAGIVPENEWDAFLDALRVPLPMSLRVNRALPGFAKAIQKIAEAPDTQCIEWMPGQRAWRCPSAGKTVPDPLVLRT